MHLRLLQDLLQPGTSRQNLTGRLADHTKEGISAGGGHTGAQTGPGTHKGGGAAAKGGAVETANARHEGITGETGQGLQAECGVGRT